MKIGIDLRTLLDKKYSGISEYSYNLIKNLLKIDQNNDYIFFVNSFSSLNPKIKELVKNKKIIHTRFPNKIFNYGMQKIIKRPYIDELLKEVDLFFMPHLNFISLSPKTKKIITIHDLSFVRNKNFFSFKKNLWHFNLNVKKILDNFDKIITVSENTKNDIIELYNIPENKIKVVYSGVSPNFKKRDKKDAKLLKIKEKYRLNSSFIFYLGNIEPRKNIEGIIKSYEKFLDLKDENKKYNLVIAGNWGWKYKNIKKIWHFSKYKNKINFLSYIDEKDKKYIYNLCDLFIYPSFYEGFGFPPLEAVFSGAKVITSFSSSLPEISNNLFTLVNPYDSNSLKIAMEKILNYDRIKENKLNIRRKEFDWKNVAKKYLEIFLD